MLLSAKLNKQGIPNNGIIGNIYCVGLFMLK